MKVNGTLIKEYRKNLHFTQKKLAEGICEQATISNIENKNMSPGISILSAICNKLGVDIKDILIESEEDKIRNKVQKIFALNKVSKYAEAYEIFKTIDKKKVADKELLNRILYCEGLLNHLVVKDQNAALLYFTQVMSQTNESSLYHLQAVANITMIHKAKGELDFAKIYAEKATAILGKYDFTDLMVCAVYYNIATYYSEIKDYQKAIELCDKGIGYNKKYQTTHALEYLVYEKAFCLRELADDRYLEKYMDAKKIAEFNGNDHVVAVILKDLAE